MVITRQHNESCSTKFYDYHNLTKNVASDTECWCNGKFKSSKIRLCFKEKEAIQYSSNNNNEIYVLISS